MAKTKTVAMIITIGSLNSKNRPREITPKVATPYDSSIEA